eukprot:10609838-Lingulodinium_polyedra.AAC.1
MDLGLEKPEEESKSTGKRRAVGETPRDLEKSDPLLCKVLLIHPAPDENREVDPMRCDPGADGGRADAAHDRRWE